MRHFGKNWGKTSRMMTRAILATVAVVALLATAIPVLGAVGENDVNSISPINEGLPATGQGAVSVAAVDSDVSGTTIDIQVPKIEEEEITVNGDTFQLLSIPDYGYIAEVGKPQIPVIRETVAIPDGASVTATVADSSYTTYTGYNVYPVQQPETDDDGDSEFVIDEDFYSQNAFYPEEIVEVRTPGIWRDIAVVSVQVNPVQFNPVSGELRVYEHITVQLEYSGGTYVAKTVEPEYGQMYRSTILNYGYLGIEEKYLDSQDIPAAKEVLSVPDGIGLDEIDLDGTPILTGVKLLSIRAYDEVPFADIKPLLDWHKKRGLPYMSAWAQEFATASAIKDYINAVYASHPELKYVLLVGDIDLVTWQQNWNGYPGDYWYACVTGGSNPDLYPELAVGRLTVNNVTELNTQIDKIIEYSDSPPATAWLNRALLIAHMQEAPEKYQGCKESIRTAAYSDPFTFDTCYGASAANGGDDATNADVNSAINAGRNIVNYRGHGGTNCWCNDWNTSNEEYWTSTAHALTNGDMTPVVFSIACKNAYLDSGSETLSEAFVKDDQSAVAFLGAARPSYTIPNHDFDRFLFDAIGNEHIYNIGLVLNDANTELVNKWISDPLYSYFVDNCRMYLWLGDPALELWSGTPLALSATYPATVQNSITVTVKHGTLALSNALVCLTKGDPNNPDIYTYGYTNTSGQATFNFNASSNGPMNVSVTKHNYWPHKGTTTVDTTAPAVTVTAPNGGEVWNIGDVHNITWTATDTIDSIDIYYSVDGGSSYPYTIATGEANDGTYAWTIPNKPSSTCRVKVSAEDEGGLVGADVSNANFTIGAPDIWTQPESHSFDVTLPPNTTWDGKLKLGNAGNQELTYDISDTETTPGPYFRWATQDPDPLPAYTSGKQEAMVGDPDGLGDIDYVKVWVHMNPSDWTYMDDDGIAPDETAGDGVYTCSVYGGTGYGAEWLSVMEAVDTAGNCGRLTIPIDVDISDAATGDGQQYAYGAPPEAAVEGTAGNTPGVTDGTDASGNDTVDITQTIQIPMSQDVGDVVKYFPAPSGGPLGLAWDGTYLWNVDWTSNMIYKINPDTGAVVNSFPSPGTRPYGLTYDGAYLWVALRDADTITQINPASGSVIRSIPSPGSNPEGLAWDGEHLWVGEYIDKKIYKIDPADGSVLQYFDWSGSYVGGLTWDGAYLWHSDPLATTIYKLDPADGSIITYFTAPNGYPGGLTWDGAYLWNADADSDYIYRIDVGSLPDCPWLAESPDSGSVAAYAVDEVAVNIDTTGMAEGDYSAEMYIRSNDAGESPTIVPVQLTVKPAIEAGAVLFDESHSPVSYFTIDEYFKDWADLLRSWGFTVDSYPEGTITYELLSQYCAVVIPGSSDDYTDDEVNAIIQYVNDGGGLLIFGEYGGYSSAMFQISNELAAPFDMSFNSDTVYDTVHNVAGRPYWPLIPDFDASVVGADVDTVVEYAACTVNSEGTAFPIAWAYRGATADMDVLDALLDAAGAVPGEPVTPPVKKQVVQTQVPEGIDATTGEEPVSESAPAQLAPIKDTDAGGKVLWDLTHGVYLSYEPAGYYSDLVVLLTGKGYTIETTNAGVDNVNLDEYAVVVVCLGSAWNSAYTAAEVDAIADFVANGGGLLVMGDRTTTPNDNINPVSGEFGTTCGLSNAASLVSNLAVHPIFDGVTQFQANGPGEIEGVAPSQEVAWDDAELAVVSVAAGAGRVVTVGDINLWSNSYLTTEDNQLFAENVFDWISTPPEQPVVMAASLYGSGRAMVIGDRNLFYSGDPEGNGVMSLYEYDNEKLAVNIIDWLCQPLAPNKPDLVVIKKEEKAVMPQKYLHSVKPLFDPMRPIEDPVDTYWHELYPVYCTNYQILEWKDNGDKVLSPSDWIVMEDTKTEEVDAYHVDRMTITILVDDYQTAFECLVPYANVEWAMANPKNPFWHLVYPEFCIDYAMTGWKDNDLNRVISAGDAVTLQGVAPDSKPIVTTVDEVSWDIIVSPALKEGAKTYMVTYTIRNQGTATAPRGHSATLYVDKATVEHQVIAKDLVPGDTFTISFRTIVECTDLQDVVRVCADDYNQIDELSEKNNCLINIRQCCEPSIDVIKKVWDKKTKEWVEETCAQLEETVRFQCTIKNNGECCNLTSILVKDILSESLKYADRATVNGEPWEPVETGPNMYEWNLKGWVLEPGQSIVIEFDAIVVRWSEKPDINVQSARAYCRDFEVWVEDRDTAAVQPYICGDVNMDAKVNMADVMILWYDFADYPSAGAWVISNECAADVNCDGKINMADVMILWYDFADYPSAGAWVVKCCE